MDSTVADFATGAAEQLSPDNDDDHWDVIEGQGSLFHPGFAPVSLGLLLGSQPDALVICHQAGRTHVNGYPHVALPSLSECAELNLRMARMTNPDVRVAGISLNTRTLSDDEAKLALSEAEAELGVPAIDPIRFGTDRLVTVIMDWEQA